MKKLLKNVILWILQSDETLPVYYIKDGQIYSKQMESKKQLFEFPRIVILPAPIECEIIKYGDLPTQAKPPYVFQKILYESYEPDAIIYQFIGEKK